MVIAHHIIFGAYGFWLPNDPRGSWSREVWADHLRPFGPAKKVSTRSSVAHVAHDNARRLEAKRNLLYPAVRFTGPQAQAIAKAFGETVRMLELSVYACAIMPDHVHLVTCRHRRTAEDIAGFLKRAASRRLAADELHPFTEFRRDNGHVPSPWTDSGRKVFLNTSQDVRQRIRYVEENPIKTGFRPQRWSFVVPYDD
jgi:REP element-mobilizing transposase RayT